MTYNLKELLELSNKDNDTFYRIAITNNAELLLKHLSDEGAKIIDKIEGDLIDVFTKILTQDTDDKVYYVVDNDLVLSILKTPKTPLEVEYSIRFLSFIRTLNDIKLKNVRIIFVYQKYYAKNPDNKYIETCFDGMIGNYLHASAIIKCCPSVYLYSCPIIFEYEFFSMIAKTEYKPVRVIRIKLVKHREHPSEEMRLEVDL